MAQISSEQALHKLAETAFDSINDAAQMKITLPQAKKRILTKLSHLLLQVWEPYKSFDEMFVNTKAGDLVGNMLKGKQQKPCQICGTPTQWIEINLEVPLCCHSCVAMQLNKLKNLHKPK